MRTRYDDAPATIKALYHDPNPRPDSLVFIYCKHTDTGLERWYATADLRAESPGDLDIIADPVAKLPPAPEHLQ